MARPKRSVLYHRRRAQQRLLLGIVVFALAMVPVACGIQLARAANLNALLPGGVSALFTAGTQVAPAAGTQQPGATATAAAPEITQPAAQSTLPAATQAPTRPAQDPTDLPTPTATNPVTPLPPVLYYTQAGDTLNGLAARFNVKPEEITSPQTIPLEGLFDPNILLIIPQRLGQVSSEKQLIPDSEVVYSPSALDLNVETFIKTSGGYLSGNYREWRSIGWQNGAQTIRRVAIENSINPRLLLAILEVQSHWVYGQPANLAQTDYPIGFLSNENDKASLYYQLSWAVQQLNIGYYGWRDGRVTELTFPDGSTLRLAPQLNAGSVAIMYLFSRLYNQQEWAGVLSGPEGLMTLYENMFGNPWLRAQSVEPLFPATLTQPPLELPFTAGHTWSFTGGPHSAWGPDGARAALDFAPSSTEHGCVDSDEWATAAASGLVVRSGNGVVVLDLDGDGYEQTGWALLYLHIASKNSVAAGTFLNTGDPIGHPSCEGGIANGTHIHIARKYNGEWILADGPMPFNLSGWRAHAKAEAYYGWLTRGEDIVYSSLVGAHESLVTRPKDKP